MTPDRWSRTKEILEAAWEVEAGSRAAFLDQACAADPELRAHVQSLLASDEAADGFLADPAVDLEAVLGDGAGDESPELTGTRIGRYTIQNLIGKGGMGAVYLAVREDDFRMQVAIKLLKRGTDTDATLGRFRNERQILAGLQHPNIARLLDGGATEAGLPYLVMEHVDGTPLLQYAEGLSIRQRLELFRAVCQAVHHAHQRSIVHRDIKPANILVTRDGNPKLLDFGIAKLLEPSSEDATLTATGMRPMTLAYASPEQIRGEPVTTATDIYSLGAVLYELLTGERVKSGEVPPKPSAIDRQVDSDLDNIVLMALRPEPERRYATAEDLSDDLGRFLENMPVHARPESAVYRVRKFLRRNRVLALTIGLTAVIVLAVAAGVVRLTRPHAEVRSIAVLPLENLSGDKEQDYFAEGVTDALINSLAEIPNMRVISRTSSMTFKSVRRPLPEIARTLGVRTIAEGSVLRAGNRVRLTLRLVDGLSERALWSSSYEGELRDVLALQEKIVAAVAEEIGVTLSERGPPRQSRTRRVDIAAYDAYLKGRHEFLNAFNESSMKKAIDWFQQALSLDPGYAPAYAGLAECYYQESNQYEAPNVVMPKARSAALKAIELDDTLGEAHAGLALVRSLYEFNRSEGEKGFRRAIELKPGDAGVRLWYALHLTGMGRFDDAVAQLEQAQKLDPVSLALNAYAGGILYYAHRFDEVIRRMHVLIEKDPNYHQPHAWLGLAYEQKGDLDQAIAEMQKALDLYPAGAGDGGEDGRAQLGHMYAVSGQTSKARRILSRVTEAAKRRYVSPWDFALLHAGLGDREEALRWVEKVEQDRSEMFTLLDVDPRFDVLRADVRFMAVLRRASVTP